MKKMAQRSMWRGNRDEAHSIESHGMYGMRVNNKANAEMNHGSPTGLNANVPTGATQTHTNSSAVNIHTTNNHTTTKKDDTKNDDQQKSGLGGSIIDALQ